MDSSPQGNKRLLTSQSVRKYARGYAINYLCSYFQYDPNARLQSLFPNTLPSFLQQTYTYLNWPYRYIFTAPSFIASFVFYSNDCANTLAMTFNKASHWV
jgi:hypothetical protein